MDLPTTFSDFLKDIRPDTDQQSRMKAAHEELRSKLEQDKELSSILLGTFIQGSYRRHTGIRGNAKNPCDVDVVVVTSLPHLPQMAAHALEVFRPFLKQHYPGLFTQQDRSWCINVGDDVKLDLVPTAEPEDRLLEWLRSKALDAGAFPSLKTSALTSLQPKTAEQLILEAAEVERGWDRAEPLWIPNAMRTAWEQTHPLAQIAWTAEKNKACAGHFVGVVKVLKWWKRTMAPSPKRPKGYPLEFLVGDCCPSGINSVAEGLAATLEEIRDRFQRDAVASTTPVLPDRDLPANNVFARIDGNDFACFHGHIAAAADLARRAVDARDRDDSQRLWHELLGDPFPAPQTDASKQGGFTTPARPSAPAGGRFA